MRASLITVGASRSSDAVTNCAVLSRDVAADMQCSAALINGRIGLDLDLTQHEDFTNAAPYPHPTPGFRLICYGEFAYSYKKERKVWGVGTTNVWSAFAEDFACGDRKHKIVCCKRAICRASSADAAGNGIIDF
nr:hypothetical protein Iba_chr09cCG3380 [Ipomoea batatas]